MRHVPKTPYIVVLPGQGIGPEIIGPTFAVLLALRMPMAIFQYHDAVDPDGKIRPLVIEAVRRYGVALKGPFATPIGEGHESINVQLRRVLDLYANVRPIRSFPGIPSPYHDIDIVVIRENLEGLYSGVEYGPVDACETFGHPRIAPTAATTCSTATPEECERIAEFAFQYAVANGRSKVTIAHKANIAKCTDGIFLRIAHSVAEKYPSIETEDLIIDNLCQALVRESWKNPKRFDIILCPNHWGDIVSEICAGMVGGVGIAPSGQYGKTAKYTKAPYVNKQYSDTIAVFEAIHGTAPKITGKGIANPSALFLSAAMMLTHVGFHDEADRLNKAISSVFAKGCWWRPKDLDGEATTTLFTNAVVAKLKTM